MAQPFDICIRGAGIVGRTLALLLAQAGLRVALVAPPAAAARAADVRAYALNAASQALLASLRAWPEGDSATAVTRIEVFADQDGRLAFDAGELHRSALAWIVDVPALEARLADAVRFQPLIEPSAEPVAAPLTLVCEGRASGTRAEFGAAFDVTPCGQSAIATRLSCALPHGQVARQWFAPDGSILAFLPLEGAAGNSVALVWSVPEHQADHWMNASDDEFTHALEAASRGALGALRLSTRRARWPLQQARARRWCGPLPGEAARSWALAGDAAHNLHPLAGQGLNLGLADAQALARLLRSREDWRGPADLRLLRRYERERKAALAPMLLAMDGLQQLFARQQSPLPALRNWGMRGFAHSGPLKAWAARQAMGARQ